MKQLPFILVLVLSSGLLLWNFRRYDVVHAEESARVARASGVRAVERSNAVRPEAGRTTGQDPRDGGGPSAAPGTGTRVALVSPMLLDPAPEMDEAVDEPAEAEPEEAQVRSVVRHNPEGELRAEGTTVNGMKQGRWLEWWGPDQLLSDGNYALGQREGPWTYWYENGEIKEQGAYKDDLPDGPWSSQYADGSPRMLLSYADGLRHGRIHEWAADGSSLREGRFNQGEPDGRWVESNPDGTPRTETHYLNGLRHGSHRAWYTDGQLKEQGEYSVGRRQGRWFFYDAQGGTDQLRSGYYEQGRRSRP